MKRSYQILPEEGPYTRLAKSIVALILDSEVSYDVANNALEAAQDLLSVATRPVKVTAPQTSD